MDFVIEFKRHETVNVAEFPFPSQNQFSSLMTNGIEYRLKRTKPSTIHVNIVVFVYFTQMSLSLHTRFCYQMPTQHQTNNKRDQILVFINAHTIFC